MPLVVITVMASASYSIDRGVLGSGGGSATGGNYAVVATAGQPITGWAYSKSYMGCWGFWCGPGASAAREGFITIPSGHVVKVIYTYSLGKIVIAGAVLALAFLQIIDFVRQYTLDAWQKGGR